MGDFAAEIELQQPVTAGAWYLRRLGLVCPRTSLGEQREPKEGAARVGLVARSKELDADIAAARRGGLLEFAEARAVVQPRQQQAEEQ